MIKNPVTLIIGAGASVPYGYPTGAQLIDQIVSLLNWSVMCSSGTTEPLIATRDRARERLFKNEHLEIADFCFKVREFRPSNIDSFLRDNPKLEFLGRQVVSFLIKQCEINDHGLIANTYPSEMERVGYPWYPVLFEALIGRTKEDLESLPQRNGLKIITFNYDVSLEYFLARALIGNERTRPFAAEIYNSIPIIHMFGKISTVGISEGAVRSTYGDCRDITSRMGSVLETEAWTRCYETPLHVAIENKHTHPDVVTNSKAAIELMQASRDIVCMGFDFAPDNCDLLKIHDWHSHPTYYMNYRNSANLDARVRGWTGKHEQQIHKLKSKTCYDALIDEYDLTH